MLERDLDLRMLNYAVVSAERGSFRRAAAELNVQQSTVSRGVRSLEYCVGIELFERGHSGIRATAAGIRFLEEAALGVHHLDRAMRCVKAIRRGEHGDLTVALSVPFALVSHVFQQFRSTLSGVSLDIVECTTAASRPLVEQRKVDIAFIAKYPETGTLQSFHISDARMSLLVPKSHPLANSGKISLDELSAESVILSAGGIGPDIEERLLAHMAKRGLTLRAQLHRVSEYNVIEMVASGFGVTITVDPPSRALNDCVTSVPLAGRCTLSLQAVWTDANSNPALKALIELIRRHDRLSRLK